MEKKHIDQAIKSIKAAIRQAVPGTTDDEAVEYLESAMGMLQEVMYHYGEKQKKGHKIPTRYCIKCGEPLEKMSGYCSLCGKYRSMETSVSEREACNL